MPRYVTVHRDGDHVALIVNGLRIFEAPWEAADEIASAIKQQCRRIEEERNAEAVALDQALLIRKGVPLGLTSHPKIQAEAVKEAAWNRNLRRYLPGSIASGEQFGTPALTKGDPPCRKT